MVMCIKRKEGLVFNRIDDEVVLFHLETEQYFGMNAVGSRIWDLLLTPQTLGTLCEALMQEFEIDHEAFTREVQLFLASLSEHKLIEDVAA